MIPNICAIDPIESPDRMVYGMILRGGGGGFGIASVEAAGGEADAYGAGEEYARGADGYAPYGDD